jgi:hypothetical protein
MSSFLDPPKPFEPAPEGISPARLVWCIDLGTHPDTFEGKTTNKRKLCLGFELIGTHMLDGRPFLVTERYTITDGQYSDKEGRPIPYAARTSNLCAMLKKWKSVNDKAVQGLRYVYGLCLNQEPASLTLEHAPKKLDPSKINVKIESIKAYKGKEELPEAVNPVLIYARGMDLPETLPEWIKKEIASCMENNGGVPARVKDTSGEPLPEAPHDVDDSDIPF